MDRYYALPLSFAAAFHAALLFGFSKPPRMVSAPPTKTTPDFIEVKRVDEDPPLVEPSETASSEQKLVLDPPPRSIEPEPTLIDAKAFVTRTRPPLPGLEGVDTNKIPLDFIPSVGPGTGGGGPVLPIDWLDKTPTTRFQPAPAYPFEGKQQGMAGEVLVEFVVDERGRVHDPRVVSSTSRIFEEPTLRAVAKWIFEPGRRNGEVVRFKMAVPVQFKLNE
jgi:periplasmic protein TonB